MTGPRQCRVISMSDNHLKRRQQREFLFVFSSASQCGGSSEFSVTNDCNGILSPADFDQDEAIELRQRLISELREFGC